MEGVVATSQHPTTSSADEEAEQQRLAHLWAGQTSPLKPYRHLHIDWPNMTIKKTLAIGPSAPDANPPIYDLPLAHMTATAAASCMLVTKNSPITATIYILRDHRSDNDGPHDKPISVSAQTGTASISLTVPEYSGSRPLHIRVKANHGNLTVALPQSFAGLLSWRTETGSLKLSDSIQARYKLLDDRPHKHRGTARIVPATASGNRGDACEIVNKHGSVTIVEAGEKYHAESCTVM